jgi:hypothetical protein
MDLFISLLIALFGISSQDASSIRQKYDGMGDEAVKIQIQKMQELNHKYITDVITSFPAS